jgi:hypothetical protein
VSSDPLLREVQDLIKRVNAIENRARDTHPDELLTILRGILVIIGLMLERQEVK